MDDKLMAWGIGVSIVLGCLLIIIVIVAIIFKCVNKNRYATRSICKCCINYKASRVIVQDPKVFDGPDMEKIELKTEPQD